MPKTCQVCANHQNRYAKGQINRRQSQQDRKEAHDTDGQQRTLPGIHVRGVDGQIDVAVFGENAGVDVGVEPAHLLHVVGINPEGEGRAQIVVERRLARLLVPGAGLGRVKDLHRQRIAVGQVADHGIMPQFVRGFKGGGSQGVSDAQQGIDG